MKNVILVLVLATAVCAAGCAQKSEAKKAEAAVQKPAVAVETTVAASGDLVEGIEVTGSLEPKFAADVKTQIPGLIRRVYVNEWVRVRKGTPLARIDIAETEALEKRAEAAIESARANLAQTQVAATRADRELSRSLKLKEAGLATQQSVDDARSEAAAAAARIDAAKAQIRVAEEELRQARARQAKGMVVSPIDGVVALRAVNVGDLASDAAAAKPIFRIVDNRILNLTVTVSSADSARVRVGQPLDFTVDSLPARTFTGRVMYINPELSAADRSLKVIAEVRNDGELLKGGLFAKGRIVSGKRGGVLQLPRGALSAWDTQARKGAVFVIEGDTARLRPVATGITAGDLVEIASGLRAGERYVSRGGFNLKDGDKVAIAATAPQPSK
jgi:membrane fusion protein (multidrug efflux system)